MQRHFKRTHQRHSNTIIKPLNISAKSFQKYSLKSFKHIYKTIDYSHSNTTIKPLKGISIAKAFQMYSLKSFKRNYKTIKYICEDISNVLTKFIQTQL